MPSQPRAEYLWQPTDHISWRFRYLFGYGHGRVFGLNLRPSIDYHETPTYQMLRVALELNWFF